MSKLIFLPHCLRDSTCQTKLTEHGYTALHCGKCNICEFRKKAESKGYNVFVVPGGSMVKKIMKDFPNPELVIGVACGPELKEAMEIMKKHKINAKTLALSKDGCMNTEVNWQKLYAMI